MLKIYKKMKYIRKFNEGKNITDELKEFCSENLAYLIDGGFHILYSTGFIMQDYYTGVSINKMVDNSYKIFNWHDIRDDVIPFFDILSRKYIVSDITFSLLIKINSEAYGLKKDIMVKLDDIIGDNLEDYDIFKISFKCREK
jgi:regulator of sigma D